MVDTATKLELLDVLIEEEGDELICCPISYAQQRLWFLDQLEPGNPVYNLPAGVRLRGALQLSALERSLNEIISRHEALRTRFLTLDGEPVQVIDPEFELRLEVVDLSAMPATEGELEAQRLATAEAALPFDLTTGPLLRARLLRLAAEDHILLLTMHHIISDGWSMGVLVREVGALYRAFSEGSASPLPTLPIQYADYAVWQREQLTNEFLAEQLGYWREQLSGTPALLGLPADHVRPAVKSYRGALERFALSAELTAALKTLSREQGVTLFMVLLAALKVLLWRYSGQADVVVGTPIANRQQREIEGLIGFFVNTLALRTSIEANESFRNLLKRVREVCLGAYQHQDVPFEMVVEATTVERAMGQTPLFQVMFALQDEAPVVEMKGLQVSVLEVESGTAKFDLTLTVREDEGRLSGQVEYDTDLFEAGSIKRLVGHYERLLQGLVRDREQAVGTVLLLEPEERQQLLYDWNQTSAPVPDICLHELFEAQVERTPEAVAVLFAEQQLSYRELNRRANQLAHHLRRAGVAAESRVGVLLERSVELLIGLLGILKAGGSYVPLDPHYPQERLAFMLADAEAKVLLTQASLRERLPEWQGEIICVDRDRELIAAESGDAPLPLNEPDHLAYLIYTSGSTGRPKGVSIEHRNAVTLLHWAQAVYTPAEYAGVLASTSICFDLSIFELFVPLSWGGKVIIAENALQLPQLPAAPEVTLINTVPSAMAELARDGGVPASVRVVNLAGEPLKRSLVNAVYQLEGVEKVFNLYGPSEDTTYSTFVLVPDDDDAVTIGRPIANTCVYLLDEQLQPVPVGVAAELYIGGEGLARGYHCRPELTAERFVPNPFSAEAGARLYRTGDVARYLANGELDYLGRVDHQVKLRGFRIEVGEVESVLEQQEEIKQAVVVAREAEAGGKQLVAYLVARQSEAPTTAALRVFLKQRLPEHMVPAAFVFLSELPLTANGKLNRSALPEPGRAELSALFVGPRSETEALVCSLWAGLLKLERVGIYDNFFELGGHSLLATQLLSRLREAFQVELPLRLLFEQPTVAGLTQSIEHELPVGRNSAPLQRLSREGPQPLSFSQQRLWFLDQLEPGNPVYNIPGSVRLSGPLDLSALNQSLNEIIKRHEVLRTSFAMVEGQPVQVIEPVLELAIEVLDLSAMSTTEGEVEAQRLATAEAALPFDLTTGPLLRAKLLRLAEDEHVALFTMHHIISDGWSMGVLVHELASLYQAFSLGQPSPLAELPVQYADYAVSQREWLQGEVLAEQLGYWREQLSGAPAVLELPADHVRPAVKSYRGARERLELSAELTAALKTLSREQGVTLFMVLLATFKVLLWRYSGQTDVVVGTPIANRQQSEIEGLIGFFVNTLALRTSIEGNESFKNLLKRVREVCLGAYQHQDMPFEMVVEEMAVARALNHTPIFQVMFVLQNLPAPELLLEDVEISVLEVESGTAKFDLTLTVGEDEGRLRGQVEYDTDLFERASIKRLVGHYERLLQELVRDGEQAVGAVPLLEAEEQQQLLYDWNQTSAPVPDSGLHELFEAQVERTPTAVAVRFAEQQLSYRELNQRANQLAHHLRGLGVGPEVLVGVLMERSIELVVTLLGILKAGAAYLPLDPDYPGERLSFMLSDAQASVLLTQERLLTRGPATTAQVLCVDRDWAAMSVESEANTRTSFSPENLAYVIYTSGSTGEPKGVQITHRAICNHLQWRQRAYPLSGSDKFLHKASVSFDISVWEIFGPLLAGSTLLMAKPGGQQESAYLARLMADEKVTVAHFGPAMLQVWLQEPELEQCQALRQVFCGGEPLTVEQRDSFFARLQAGLCHQYGPTEATVDALVWECQADDREVIPLGRPIANMRAYVLDEELQPAPIGVAGELHLAGLGLARGYLKRADLTAEKFIPDPFSEQGGERLYKTGDRVRSLADGTVEFLGRLDQQVKLRGFRIELGEIEAVLSKHPAVRQSVSIVREDVAGEKRLVSYIVAAEAVESGELRRHLREMLPDYMIPSAFVLLAKLPLTPSGKVDRRALSAPDSLRWETEQGYAAPRTPIEEVLASIWANLLGLEQVGINDNFFELGGHSLLATRLMSQIRDALQIDLAVRQLFEHPTIAELAQSIEKVMRGRQKSPLQPLTLTARPGAIPLSFAQQRLWFLDQMEPGNSFYNISSALRLNGPFDHPALERSFTEVIRRHEVLRTTFQMSDEGPVQVIASEPSFSLPAFDLSALPEAERELKVQALAAAEAARPFDLSALPLLRATVLRLSAEEHILLLTKHHIISDGWSLGLLVKEVATLYRAFSRELPSPLPELGIQYADYALWQRQQLSGPLLDEQLTYWREQLQSAPAVLALPTDRSRPAVKRYRGTRETFHITEELAAELKAVSRAQRVTMFMLLLAAFKVLLWRYSGQEDIVVGTPIANRQESQIEDLIGFFVNTLALRTRLEPTERFADLLKRVREECLAGYQHQAVPFELVVEELAVERSLSYTPIFQVMFALQNELLLPGEMEDIEIKVMETEGRTAKVDLLMTIEAQETGSGLRGVIEYDTDLFERETVRRLAQHYQTLLQSIVTNGDARIGKLPLLGEEERQRILVTWNETKADYPAQSVSELFEAVVARTPEKVAVVFAQQAVSYEDLNGRANQLAHHLRALGVGPEVLVAVLTERSVETIVSFLAVLKAGGAYLPLEPSAPPARLLFMMEDCDVKLLLTQERLLGRLPEHPFPIVLLDDDQRLISSESKENLSPVGVTPEHLAYVMYTSGSTGKPKGIGIPHRGIVRLVRGANYANLSADEVILQSAPVSFDAATFEIWGSLLNGGRVVLLPAERASLEELGRTVKEHQVTTSFLTTGLFNVMVEERAEDLHGLRQLLAGGDVMSVSHVERAIRELKGCQIIPCYGPTENTTFTSCYPMTSVSQLGETVSIGRPISNTKVYLLDANLQPVPIGVPGELYIGGDGLARGYFNQPSLTAEKFIPDPFTESGARLYRSGDLARYLSDGTMEFLSRIDHQVKIRGFRIEPSEIQTVLTEHPAVAQSVVLVRSDGEGEKTLLAYVVAEQTVSVSELRAYLQARLPEYMIPTAFIMISEIPLTAHGKVDRAALLALESSEPDLTAGYVGARTLVEELLVGIWSNLLDVQRVGIYDNFFELGGHSLLAVRLLSRVRESFQVEVTLHRLFETATVAGLAEEIERQLRAGQSSLAMPIVRAQREGKLALSFAQQRLWFLDQLEPGNPVYNIPGSVRLSGSLDLSALNQSLNEIIKRHEALRTRFAMVDGQPVQVIEPVLELVIEVRDLSAMPAREAEVEAQRLATAEAALPFDLATGPLLRVKLLRLAEDEHVVLFTMHHIISDGWSMGVLVHELATLYQAFSLDQPSPLAELPVQYADYAMSQREWLQGEVLAEQLGYWREQLSGAPAVLELPADHVRPAVKSYQGAHERLELSADLTAALKTLSREQGVTLFMVLLATFKVLLWRYSGQTDVVVGTPIANRQQSEIEGLIGFFVNTLALRTNVEKSESFTSLLKRVREVCLGAYQRQDVPFEMVVEEVAVERALNHTPIFQVMFALQNMPASELLLEDVEISVLEVESGTAKFDLTLRVREDEGRLKGEIEYDTHLFEASSIKRLVGHYERLLQEIVRDAEQAVGAMPMLRAEERQQLLYDWNQTSVAVPDICLHELFEAQVERTPTAVAVRFAEHQLNYSELNQRANQLAHHLRGLGVGPEVLVGVLMERFTELVVTLLGILKAGAAYLPLDPDYPAERLSFMLSDAQAPVLLTQERLLTRVPATTAQVLCVDRDWPAISLESEANTRTSFSPENLAYVIYTSGSTGEPKGVQITHRAICNHLQWRQRAYPLSGSDRFLHKASVSFDISVWEIFGPLLAGSTLLMAKPGGQQESAYLARLMADEKVTVAHFGPAMLQVWLQEPELEQCQALRQLFCGGEPLTVGQRDSFFARLRAGLCHQYGPTEATVDALVWECQADDREVIPLGRPIANMRAYVLDEEQQPAPIGVAGELHLAGLGLARGYLKRADLTAAKFIPDPFSEQGGERLYKTGDRARYLADGTVEFLGRLDQQLKIRGFRVELGEVETLLEQHEEIKQAVVAAREAEAGGKVLVAYLVARPGKSPATAELRAFLKQRLPEYMLPAAFVFLSELPLTTTGKINRRALPEPDRPELSDSYVGPRTETEALVCSLWAGILKLERVGIYDNVFELGGHSLLATQLWSRLREAFRVELPLRLLFEQPTVAGLTHSLENELVAGRKSVAPLQRLSLEGPQPLSFAQLRLWFLDQLTPGSATYNMASAIRLSGSLNPLALQRAFNEILRRQQLLRTTFSVIDAEPMQLVSEPVDFDLPIVDLSHLERPEIERQAQLLASEEAHRPFDLTRGPLFRATLLRLATAEHVLLFTMHHIISDGWSMRVLIKELTTIYEAFSADQPSPLTDLPVQYGDFAVWQREQLQGEILEEQLQYWREQLQGAPALLELPTEHPRPPVQSYRGAKHTLEIPPQTTRALKVLSQQHSVTLFMTLLAAFQALLYRYTGQDDIVVGTPVAGRTRGETEGLIGLFLNTLALRVSLKGDPTFATLLSRVRDACLGAYAYQDVPFERLLEELAPERNLSHTPIFQVMFNMLNLDSAGEQVELHDLTIDPLPFDQQELGVKFELELYAREQGDGLTLTLVYSELFTSVAMEQMLDHFHTLLQAVVAEPEQHLAALPLSTDFRKPNPDNLIRPTNPFITFANEEIEQTIHERFEKQVRSNPGNIAIKIRNESWTYKELNHTANQIARAILATGEGDQRVALLLNHDAWMVAGILGVLKAGKTYVPLDASYPRQRLMEVLKDSEAAAVLTNSTNLLLAEELIQERIPVINLDQLDSSTPGDDLQVEGTPDSLAYILHTSGSTGKPKGVVQNHRNVLHHIRTYTNNLHICASDKLTLLSSCAVDSAVQDIFAALLNGATVCPIDVRTEDLNRLWARLNEEEITIYHSTPTVYRYFVNTLKAQETCPSVRLVVLGGEEVQKRDFELYRQHFSPLCLFVNGLGLTESTVTLQYFANQQTEITHDTVPVGYAAADNTEVALFNEAGEQVALYGVGEIIVKNPHVALGYWRQPELTEKAFSTGPTNGYGRSYRTGDLGRWLTDGTIEYVGRRDNQVKIRGYRVELGEVEAALRTCRGVSECAVVMRSGEQLVAYVVTGDLEKESISEWRQQLEERLPQYMVPTVFMVIDKMPLTASGKVNRRALPEVTASRPELKREYEEARTETEEMLAGIWREVLKVERVGVHDNFFELGGHSLLAARMVSLVRESFSVELPLRSLFESPTVAGFAARVETMLAGDHGLVLPPIERVERAGPLPLSFAQQRLWFLHQLDQRSRFFNMHQAVRLKGVFNTAALEQSLNEVFRRHEALRAKFVTVDGLPVQVIEPLQPFSLVPEDLTVLTRAEQETKVLALSKEEAHHSFDLTQAPLLRIRLLRLDSEEHVVLLTMHHIISDGWSISVFFREVSTLYSAFSEGMKPALAELPIQYADYAVWQRNRLSGDALASELSYWKKQLAGAPPALDLPADRPTASHLSQGARYSVTLPDSLVKQLKRFSLSQGATPFIVLLAALKILLFRWTMQRDIVVGTVVSNRDRVETENLIGCFMNFLPIRTETSEEETGLQLLRQIKKTVLGMYAHHDCPFEKIVEAAEVERRPDQNPLYNVAFLLQNFPRTYNFSSALEASIIPSTRDSSLLDLRFVAEEYPEGIRFWCEYKPDLFEAETIEHLVEGYCATLEKLLSEPQLILSSFTLPQELVARAEQARSRKQKQTIAIAATFTAEPVEDSLDFWMRELEIPTHCTFAPFNQVFQQLLEPSSLLATNRNGVNVLLIRLQDWGRRSHDAITETHSLVISPEEIERSVLEFIRALSSAADSSITPYLLCLCPSAPNIVSEPQTAEFFQRMEELLAASFENSDGIYCVTTTELAVTYPVLDYYDAERDQLGQVPYTPAFFTALGMMLARKVRALKSRPYKVIVLDCDETLWKGVCGEDGPLGVEINAPHRALQEFMLKQYEQGMLLCLCSHNNEEDVLEVFKQNSAMALRSEHLAAWRINWRSKTENIKALAEELQLGLDSFIFVDNDPVICMQMQAQCPEVLTLQLPVEAERIPKFLRHVWAFDHLKVTGEDRQRTALYQQNRNRERLRSDSLSLEDFLAAIELDVRISEMAPHQVARVAQLTQRTNQFNFTNIERSESELKNLCQAGQLETLVVEASDRFGDYGLVGVMIFKSSADAINVDTFLLSCRALGRKLEHRMLARLGMIAYERRKQFVNVRLLRTRKNQPAQDFLSQVGIRFRELNDGAWNFKFPTSHLLTLDETTAHRQEKAHAGD